MILLSRRSYEAAKDELSGFRHNNLTLLTMQKTDLIEEDFFNPTSSSTSNTTSSHTSPHTTNTAANSTTTAATNSNTTGEQEEHSILDPKYIQKLIDEQQNKSKEKGQIKFKSAFTSSPIDNIKLPLYMSTTSSTTTTAPSTTTTSSTTVTVGGEKGSELSPPPSPRAKVDFVPTQYWLALLKKNFVRSRTLGQGDCESNSR